MPLELSDKLKSALGQVSQEVAADLHDADPDGASDKQIVAEVCIDANRLTMFGHKEADDEVSELVKQYGYTAVVEECGKHVELW